jgi:hypothetical protein
MGQEIPISKLVAFTYQNGHVILRNPLDIGGSGTPDSTVELPLVEQLSAKGLSTQPADLELAAH